MYSFLKDFYPKFSCRKSRYEEKDDILIVSSKNLELVFLNSTAGDFVSLADGTHSLDQIVSILMDEYDVDQQELQTDIVFLVRDLQWKKLLSLGKKPVSAIPEKVHSQKKC